MILPSVLSSEQREFRCGDFRAAVRTASRQFANGAPDFCFRHLLSVIESEKFPERAGRAARLENPDVLIPLQLFGRIQAVCFDGHFKLLSPKDRSDNSIQEVR